jgi:hypothetical protein
MRPTHGIIPSVVIANLPKRGCQDDKRRGQASMAPNACGVVMGCSHFLTHEPNDMEFNSELRDVAPLSTSKPS